MTNAASLRIGVMLTAPANENPQAITPLARHVEDLGLDGIFVGDHLAAAVPILDSTVVLTTAAAGTNRIDIGFAVMTLALRPVAWAAKQVASMQRVSGNRIVLGVGAGGELHGRTAWDAVAVPYDERGRRTDEYLALLPPLIQGQPTRIGTTELTLEPGSPVPPIWIGGMSRAAMRRSIEHGDTWFPSMRTAPSILNQRHTLEEHANQRGRPTPSVALGGFAALGDDVPKSEIDDYVRSLASYDIPTDDAQVIPITGSPSQAARRFAEYRSAGVSYLVLGLRARNWRRQCELIADARQRMT